MKNPILQSLAAILLSIVIALMLLSTVEVIGAVLIPFPEGVELTREVVEEHVANYPAWGILLTGVLGWSLTMFIVCWLATRLGANRHPAHGYGIGALLLAAAAFNIASLPYALWFKIVSIVVLPLSMYLGVFLARARTI